MATEASRSERAGGGRRSLESLVEASGGQDAARLARVWPLHGEAAGPYDERLYQESCRARAVATRLLCRREDFLSCGDGDFVAAAFQVLTGHDPDRSVWQHHVDRLRTGEGSRDELLAILQDSPAARDRNVLIFEHRHVRGLLEFTGVGLREVARVLLGLTRPRVRRRFGLLADRLRSRRP